MSAAPRDTPPAPTGRRLAPPQHPSAEARAAALSEFREHLEYIDAPEGSGGAWHTCAFNIARTAQGVLRLHGLPFKDLPSLFHAAIEEYADGIGLDGELFLEEVAARWNYVKTPGLVHPVTAAAQDVCKDSLPDLPGEWVTPRLKRDTEMTLAICKRLAAYGEVFFLSCRSLADVLGCEHQRAARILKDLCTRGHLVTVKAGTQRAATRYRLPCDRDYRGNGENGRIQSPQSHAAGSGAGACVPIKRDP